VISLAPQSGFSFFTPWNSFLFSLGVYLCVLALIYFQTTFFKRVFRGRKHLALGLVNLELLAFLIIHHFLLQGDRIFFQLPYFSSTWQTVFSLALFFFGLGFFHFLSSKSSKSSQAYAQTAFLLPFVLPFLLLTFLLDAIDRFAFFDFKQIQEMSTPRDTFIVLGLTFGFMALMLVFLPPFIQWVWRCQTLEASPLRLRLEDICKRAGFKQPKLKTWTVLNHSMTAAIIGVAAPFKYILFTKKLLHQISPEAIEAILAHEIGHSDRKHLLIYPFILMGFIVLSGIFSLFFAQTIDETLTLVASLHPSFIWDLLIPLLVFVLYGGLILIYFRLVFGFFSRLFERQADLHVFALAVPPAYMIKALDELGVATGNTHHHPSWHHYSIQQRIDFLRKAEQTPAIVPQHHQKVRRFLGAYFMTLFLATLLFISPWLPPIPPFKQIQEKIQHTSSQIDRWWNYSWRSQLAEKYIAEYGLQGNTTQISNILEQTFSFYGVGKTTEEVNLTAAQRLYQAGEIQASITLLKQVWVQLSLQNLSPSFFIELVQFSDLLLNKSAIIEDPAIEALRLEYQRKMRLIKDQSKEI
jgi:STE24 endopeptidase